MPQTKETYRLYREQFVTGKRLSRGFYSTMDKAVSAAKNDRLTLRDYRDRLVVVRQVVTEEDVHTV